MLDKIIRLFLRTCYLKRKKKLYRNLKKTLNFLLFLKDLTLLPLRAVYLDKIIFLEGEIVPPPIHHPKFWEMLREHLEIRETLRRWYAEYNYHILNEKYIDRMIRL